MTIQKIALVSEVLEISESKLRTVAAALQKQVDRDFAPVWKVGAEIVPCKNSGATPKQSWCVTVKKDIAMPGALAYHDVKNGVPFSLVSYSREWTVAASHQILARFRDNAGRAQQHRARSHRSPATLQSES